MVNVGFVKALNAWVLWYGIKPVFVSGSLTFILVMAKNLN